MYQMILNLDTCQVKINIYPKNGCTKQECQESFFKAIETVEGNLSLAEEREYKMWNKEDDKWQTDSGDKQIDEDNPIDFGYMTYGIDTKTMLPFAEYAGKKEIKEEDML